MVALRDIAGGRAREVRGSGTPSRGRPKHYRQRRLAKDAAGTVPFSAFVPIEQRTHESEASGASTARYNTDAPRTTISDIGNSWVLPGPWKDVNAKVAGEELTLDNAEHDILRPIWGDNRIHYAVNCASYGCPNLLPQAFTAANAEQLFEQGTKDHINHPRGASFTDDGDLQVSSIYDWLQEDFGDSEEGVLMHLMQYADEGLAERLQSFDGDMAFEYNWKLNAP